MKAAILYVKKIKQRDQMNDWSPFPACSIQGEVSIFPFFLWLPILGSKLVH